MSTGSDRRRAFLLVLFALAGCAQTGDARRIDPSASASAPSTPSVSSTAEPFAVTMQVTGGSYDPERGFRGTLVLQAADGQRFVYGRPVAHPELYAIGERGGAASVARLGSGASGDAAGEVVFTTGASGGAAEGVVLRRVAEDAVLVRCSWQELGVDSDAHAPERDVQEHRLRVPRGAEVIVRALPVAAAP